MKNLSLFRLSTCISLALLLCLPAKSSLCAELELDDVLLGFDEDTSNTPSTAEEDFLDALDGFGEPEGNELDDILGGFSGNDDVEENKQATTSSALPPWLDLSGGIGLATSINFSHDAPETNQTDHRSFSKLRTSADLTADIRLSAQWQSKIQVKGFYDSIYDLKGRDDYTSQVLDEYVKELEIGEMWIGGSLSANLDLKIGRQIVVWGKSDNIRITDVLNPLDNREPGLIDIRDLRLPVTMSKVDYYTGKWNLSAMVLHENRFSKNPVYGNDFYMGLGLAPPENEPSTSFKNQEFGLAMNGVFSGWDLSFYGAHIFEHISHIEQIGSEFSREYSRVNMLGMATNIAHGSLLLKAETAWLEGMEYSIDVGEKSRLDLLLGAEYTGITETMISLELANRHIFNYDDRLIDAPAYTPENDAQVVLRISRDFMHDTLTLTALASVFILSDNDGAFERFTAEYELTQELQLTTGLIFYQNGSKAAFSDIGDNDRLFCELRYSF